MRWVYTYINRYVYIHMCNYRVTLIEWTADFLSPSIPPGRFLVCILSPYRADVNKSANTGTFMNRTVRKGCL